MNLFEAIFTPHSLDRTAILFEQQKISYADLRHQTLAAARMLSDLEVHQGDRVAIMLNDSPEFIAAFIAICSYGAIAVPINMALLPDEQRGILGNCSASVAIVEADLSRSLFVDAPSLKQIVIVDRRDNAIAPDAVGSAEVAGEHGPSVLAFARLMSQARDAVKSPASEVIFRNLQNQPAFILYTSGSTGEPKGAVHRQADIFYTNETYCREVLQLRDDDRLFSSSRLPFAYGLGNAFTFPLLNGCTTVLCREKPTPVVIHRVFAALKPTVFFGVPVVYSLLLANENDPKADSSLDCSSLRLCVSAGEALPPAIGEEWEKNFGVAVLDVIGSTEMLHMWMSNHQGEVVYGSSGKLLQGYDARLLDPDGRPTPSGSEGNLWVRGASAAMEYWKRPETTALTFVDGWVRTGDLYRTDSNGFWFHMGRSDDCFKSSGQWVSPVEVEAVLLRHKDVSRAAVVEDFDEVRLPCACAFVVPAPGLAGEASLEAELRELARSVLPRFKQPRRYEFVADLPYTATGKIQRFKLREQLRQNVGVAIQKTMPST